MNDRNHLPLKQVVGSNNTNVDGQAHWFDMQVLLRMLKLHTLFAKQASPITLPAKTTRVRQSDLSIAENQSQLLLLTSHAEAVIVRHVGGKVTFALSRYIIANAVVQAGKTLLVIGAVVSERFDC